MTTPLRRVSNVHTAHDAAHVMRGLANVCHVTASDLRAGQYGDARQHLHQLERGLEEDLWKVKDLLARLP